MRLNRRIAALVIICVLLVSGLIGYLLLQDGVLSEPIVGIYYYAWYVEPWSDNCRDTSILGEYDSSNASVIVQHLNWLSDLGVDFVVFSWWGKDSNSDNRTQLIVDQMAKNYTDIQFFIMVEPFGSDWAEAYDATRGYDYDLIYSYLYDTYALENSSNCFLLDGKLAVGFYDNGSRLTANGVPSDSQSRFSKRVIGYNASDDWEYQVPTVTTQRVCRDGEISVCPRYDTSSWQVDVKANWRIDVNYTEGLYGRQWSRAIYETRQGRAKIIMIMSWNEFAERTEIEPHVDYTATMPPYNSSNYLFDQTKMYINILRSIKQPMITGVLSHELSEPQAQFLSSNGVLYIRGDVSVNASEINWHSLYQLAKKYNISLIGTLLPYTMDYDDLFSLQDWEQTVKTAVLQYGDIVRTWEIWNEPTYPNSTTGYYDGTAQRYIDLMRVAYQAIKSQDPDATVLGLGGLPLYTSTEPKVGQALEFTRQVVLLGGMQYCDAISLHAYPYGKCDEIWRNAFASSISSYRQIVGKEVWITETGQESELGQTEQAGFLKESYNLLQSQGVKAYIWYELNDRANRTENGKMTTFGLYDMNSNPKLALTTFTGLAMNQTSSSSNT